MVDMRQIDVQPTAADVAARVAAWLIARIDAGSEPFRVALSGGSTPKALFALLASPEYARRVPWSRLHLFWGDERFVPYTSADSNYGEARRLLLDRVPIPAGNVFPMPTDGAPEDAASRYADTLRAGYGSDTLDPAEPLFDVNFLGLGEDGHTASLIPGQKVLRECAAWVAAVGQGRPEVRLTLTYPALNSARAVAFLVAGAGKNAIVNALRGGADVPAAHIAPMGEVLWFMDHAAAFGGQGAAP